MGYELHITRREYWSDDEGQEIAFDEFCKHVDSDPTLKRGPKNGCFLINVPNGEEWPLIWRRGKLHTKIPNEATILQMVSIAARLNAKVLGDDDEVYGADGVGRQRPVV